MVDDDNPYAAPPKPEKQKHSDALARRRPGVFTYVTWAFVFAVNLALPLLFSSSITQQHGKLGMSIAALFLLASGCHVCSISRKQAAVLISGGALVGLSQLFPFLQFIAGILGLIVGQFLGLVYAGNDERSPQIISEFGGFVVTLVTGGILMAASASAGILLRFVTPARWWPPTSARSTVIPGGRSSC